MSAMSFASKGIPTGPTTLQALLEYPNELARLFACEAREEGEEEEDDDVDDVQKKAALLSLPLRMRLHSSGRTYNFTHARHGGSRMLSVSVPCEEAWRLVRR